MTCGRILVLSWYPADTPASGERARLHALLSELSHTWDVTLLSFSAPEGHHHAVWDDLRPEAGQERPYAYTRSLKLRSVMLHRSAHVLALDDAPSKQRVVTALKEVRPDLVVCNQLPPLSLVPREWLSRTVLDTHNAEHPRLKRKAQAYRRGIVSGAVRFFISDQSRLALRLETTMARQLAGVVATSEEEATYFRSIGARSVALVPNGTYIPAGRTISRARPEDPFRLLYVGSLGYSANRAALLELLDDWLPKQTASWKLDIVGSGDPGAAIRARSAVPGVNLRGRVDDILNEYISHDLLVAPIRQAGGTRLKVLEAAGARLPIFATRVAVEGIGMEPGVHYCLVDDAADLEQALSRYREDPSSVDAIAGAAFELVSGSFSWPAIAEQFSDFLRSR